jgi:hypothetical protein
LLERLTNPPWWLWPAFLLLLGVSSFAAALILEPRPDEFCYIFGHKFGDECAFTVVSGLPCPQCGMTRAFAWGARGHLIKAWLYNPGGIALFLWMQAGAIVGAARLVRRDAKAWTLPPRVVFGWTLLWLIGLYTVPWFLRIGAGVNPLP